MGKIRFMVLKLQKQLTDATTFHEELFRTVLKLEDQKDVGHASWFPSSTPLQDLAKQLERSNQRKKSLPPLPEA
jgi:hypothetical protein